ncbi:MAG: ribosomal protein S18-alanine N-acetyltransferase [Chloroflexota bacterium]
MPYILENMLSDDIPQVARIERLCFSLPWPTSAYRRELKTPETNRYIIERFIPPGDVETLGLPEPTEANLTSLYHPQLHLMNGREPGDKTDPGVLSRWATMLPWMRNGSENGAAKAGTETDYPLSGYAGLWLMVDEAHVTTIGVHPDHRGQGAGELLFLGLADISREMKATRMTLEVRVSNLSAQALYRKYGLEIAGVRRRYYSDNGEDAYIMWSEPVASPEFQNRIATLRAELTARLKASFHNQTPPAHVVDATRLQ